MNNIINSVTMCLSVIKQQIFAVETKCISSEVATGIFQKVFTWASHYTGPLLGPTEHIIQGVNNKKINTPHRWRLKRIRIKYE
jgi:hypothetical protein